MRTRLLVSSAALAVFYIAALGAPRLQLPMTVSATFAGAAILAFGWFIVEEIRLVRALDELQQRIQLEALALAFPLSILMIVALGLIERLVPLPIDDLSYRHVWPFFIGFYFAGLGLSARRYR